MAEPMPVAGAQRTRRKNAGRPPGRRALLWAAALFALSQAALALLLARDGFAVRDPVRRGRLEILRARIAAAPSPPKLVALAGSSHVKIGVRTLQMSREASEALGRPVVVTNQAVSGGGAFRSLLAVDRLLREGVVPDLLVVETFPPLLDKTLKFQYGAGAVALPLDQLDGDDIELLLRHGFDRSDLGPSRHRNWLVPAHFYHANLVDRFAPWLLPPERHRVLPPEEATWGELPPELRAKAVAQARFEYAARLRDLTLGDPRQVGALDDLVGRVRARGTRVVLLATPEGPLFRSWYPPDRWEASAAWLRDLAARHGVPLIDARGWTEDEALFYDSHHLTKEGSERFSRWLTREILVPQLREGR